MTRMFRKYAIELAVRVLLLGIAAYLIISDPPALDISSHFGLHDGIDFVDVAFAFMFADMATKLIPHAKIAIGSRKQWGLFHKPTASTVDDQVREVLSTIGEETEISECYEGAGSIPACATCSAECPHQPASKRRLPFNLNLPELDIGWLQELPGQVSSSVEGIFEEHIARPAAESAKGIQALSKQVARQLASLSGKEIDEELLESDDEMRSSIRANRIKEIVPVIVVWILFNALVAMILLHFDVLSPAVCFLWALFYFVSDMICVVAWCPFQVLLMRNRCCTTCQIFNWDGIMAVTPLVFAPCMFSWVLIALALVVLIRWEVAFLRNPERFDERTNASLSCANCQDKLCVIRRPLREKRCDDER